MADVIVRLDDNQLHLIHEALMELAFQMHDTPREDEILSVLDLRSRFGGLIDGLIIAAGGDPT